MSIDFEIGTIYAKMRRIDLQSSDFERIPEKVVSPKLLASVVLFGDGNRLVLGKVGRLWIVQNSKRSLLSIHRRSFSMFTIPNKTYAELTSSITCAISSREESVKNSNA